MHCFCLKQAQLITKRNFKLFFCHDTITVVVMCTIADAKVLLGSAAWLVQELIYNCYNVYFYECLLLLQIIIFNISGIKTAAATLNKVTTAVLSFRLSVTHGALGSAACLVQEISSGIQRGEISLSLVAYSCFCSYL